MKFVTSALLLLVVVGCTQTSGSASPNSPIAIIVPKAAVFEDQLAAREVRRYAYVRTGKLLPIIKTDLDHLQSVPGGMLIVIDPQRTTTDDSYSLDTTTTHGRSVLMLKGKTLYAAYDLAEKMGMRFYLEGDVAPDEKTELTLPEMHETHKPLFNLRGIQPFHDFPEGPDWWNTDSYRAILSQLPKLKMNFFGLHTYPMSQYGPEPLVWIGPPDEIGKKGNVKASYPAGHFTTINSENTWVYQGMKTSDYSFGAADIFDRDDFGADYMNPRGEADWRKMSPTDSNGVFDRMGALLNESFGWAHQLGVKTCLGTETPLTVPTALRERLKAAGKDFNNPAVIQELYEGIFRRIMQTHDLDYYWIWTEEDWTWQPAKQEDVDAVLADFRYALAAMKKVAPSFTLATCGWVLGPQQDRALFDKTFPKSMPVSCINRAVGNQPVEPGFADVQGRTKWAIPWMEDDPGMILPQLWAGRMRKDAVDAKKYGCDGLMGIHWRTRVIGPNVAALADAAWDQSFDQTPKAVPPHSSARGGPTVGRYLPTNDFYTDWATAQFGPDAGNEIGAVFSDIDCLLPRPGDWLIGPGGVNTDTRPWTQVSKNYAFVDRLESLSPNVHGAGNLERFNYWLNQFRYLRATAKVSCDRGRYVTAMKKVKKQTDITARKQLARDTALPILKDLVADFRDVHGYLLATITTSGEMGTIANWQQHTIPTFLLQPAKELAELLGEPLPPDALPDQVSVAEPRLFVPVIQTAIRHGESLKVEAIILGGKPKELSLSWRRMGQGSWHKLPMTHIARGVYRANLPADATSDDFEYFITAPLDGTTLRFPPALAVNQTVIVMQ